jgi:DNA repair exonuclease SbcCD ATPase subunit
VEQTMIRGVKQYHIPSSDVLLQKIHTEQEKITALKTEYQQAQQQFELLTKKQSHYIPKIQQFEGIEGIRQRYQDMIRSIVTQGVLVIKCTVTTIFASQVTKFEDLQMMYDEFIDYLECHHISLQ